MTDETDQAIFELARALRACLVSENEVDIKGVMANPVDGLFAIARALEWLAKEVKDASGGIERELRGIGNAISHLEK